jgi:hypothetical protein
MGYIFSPFCKMIHLIDHESFRKDYENLGYVSLDAARHEAANAYEHCD